MCRLALCAVPTFLLFGDALYGCAAFFNVIAKACTPFLPTKWRGGTT